MSEAGPTRVLLAGGSGLIGSSVARNLAARGDVDLVDTALLAPVRAEKSGKPDATFSLLRSLDQESLNILLRCAAEIIVIFDCSYVPSFTVTSQQHAA